MSKSNYKWIQKPRNWAIILNQLVSFTKTDAKLKHPENSLT